MKLAPFFRSALGLSLLTVILALSASILVVFIAEPDSVLGAVAQLVLAGLLFIGVPLCIIRHLYKERASEYGWRLPECSRGTAALGVGILALHVAMAFVLARIPAFQEFYLLVGDREQQLIFTAVLFPALFYLAEEFLFRGFLLFALWRRYGMKGAVLSVALFALLHFGKPTIEVGVAVISGALLAVLSLKTKSFVPAAVIHFVMALTLTLLVTFVYA